MTPGEICGSKEPLNNMRANKSVFGKLNCFVCVCVCICACASEIILSTLVVTQAF